MDFVFKMMKCESNYDVESWEHEENGGCYHGGEDALDLFQWLAPNRGRSEYQTRAEAVDPRR